MFESKIFNSDGSITNHTKIVDTASIRYSLTDVF